LFEGRRRRGERTKASARTVADLMSTPAVTVPASTSLAAAARLMDDEGVKRLPVVDDLGRLIGIVSRGDLLKVRLRPDDEILAEVESDVLRTFLTDDADTVRAAVRDGVVTLTGRVDRISTRDIVDRLIRKIPGVVAVVDEIEYNYDDRAILGTGITYGVA
jgi:CBS-domain-containing membrane protein